MDSIKYMQDQLPESLKGKITFEIFTQEDGYEYPIIHGLEDLTAEELDLIFGAYAICEVYDQGEGMREWDEFKENPHGRYSCESAGQFKVVETLVGWKITYLTHSATVNAPKDAPIACLMGWYWETHQRGAPTLEQFAQMLVQEIIIPGPELNYEQLADYAQYQHSAIVWARLAS